MRARSISVLGPAYSVFGVFIATIATLSVPCEPAGGYPGCFCRSTAALCRIAEVLSQDCESMKEAPK